MKRPASSIGTAGSSPNPELHYPTRRMMEQKKSADGVLLVDKISGITSHDVVERFRRRAKVKKAGHTGTLDPLATGLLVLCVGKATRLQAYLMGMEKT